LIEYRAGMPLVQAVHAGAVATLTMDSPSNRNALSSAMVEQLSAAIEAAAADPEVRLVVLSHTGRVFCSGADLKETAAAHAAADAGAPAQVPSARMGELLSAVWHCPKPVLARIAGSARAGGVGLVAAADLAVCSISATFAFSEVRLGVVPAVISSTVLPRLAPRAAAELYLTGDVFDGVRAERIGLVTAAVPDEELDQRVANYTASLLRGAPGALATAKALARRPPIGPEPAELAYLTDLSVRFFTSSEGREGVLAFAEKREPAWLPTVTG
jgi:methylglutaconyl-CoA hydratase